MKLDRSLQRAGRDTLEAWDAVRRKSRQRHALEQIQDAKLLDARPDNHSFSSGGRGLFSWPLASSLVGPIARFPGRPPLDRPTVGGVTPTLLVESRSEAFVAPPTFSPPATCVMAMVLSRKRGG